MRNSLLILLFLFAKISSAQKNTTWYVFWNKDTTLFGYRDHEGTIKIEPKFASFCYAPKFDHLIAVTEEKNGKWINYHLTKSGKIVGRDSLHYFDNTCDCESEGFIRFKDTVSDQVGIFNRNGTIAIPPIYNCLSRVHNGLIVALTGAEKKYWDKDPHAGCRHYSWTGGKTVLLDTNNNVLVENFSNSNELNLYTLKISKAPPADTTMQTFKALDNSYYAFNIIEKEFNAWLFNNLLNNLQPQTLLNASFDSIEIQFNKGYTILSKHAAMKLHYSEIKKGLSQILEPKCDYFIMNSSFVDPFYNKNNQTQKYYNNCGEYMEWQYPVLDIVITHGRKRNRLQNHYTFLRTETGYQLFSVTIRN